MTDKPRRPFSVIAGERQGPAESYGYLRAARADDSPIIEVSLNFQLYGDGMLYGKGSAKELAINAMTLRVESPGPNKKKIAPGQTLGIYSKAASLDGEEGVLGLLLAREKEDPQNFSVRIRYAAPQHKGAVTIDSDPDSPFSYRMLNSSLGKEQFMGENGQQLLAGLGHYGIQAPVDFLQKIENSFTRREEKFAKGEAIYPYETLLFDPPKKTPRGR